MATVVDMQEAEAHLSSLISRMEQGEEIVIARGDVEVAKLVPIHQSRLARRVPGTLKGKISLPDSFFDPLPEDELRLWEGR